MLSEGVNTLETFVADLTPLFLPACLLRLETLIHGLLFLLQKELFGNWLQYQYLTFQVVLMVVRFYVIFISCSKGELSRTDRTRDFWRLIFNLHLLL